MPLGAPTVTYYPRTAATIAATEATEAVVAVSAVPGPQGPAGPQGDPGPAGADGADGFLTPSPMTLYLHADAGANLTLTNSPSAERFILNVPGRAIRGVTLDSHTQVRLHGYVITQGTASTVLTVVYKSGAHSTTLGSFSDLANSGELTISLFGTGQKDSGWVTLPAGATGDIWIGLTERGGDGVADPALGYVAVSFK